MKLTYSLYLDLIRFGAAFAVLLGHFSHSLFTENYLNFPAVFLHDAVIIFFVLSGYVIAMVANQKDSTFENYILSRLSRLYSVVFPALVFTFLLDSIGVGLDPSRYSTRLSDDSMILSAAANLIFVQQFWLLDIRAGSNGPLWSLSYEFWYYICFGAYFYLRGWSRYFVPLACLFLAGPRITILFPCWIFGVAAYYLQNASHHSKPWAAILFWLTPLLYIFCKLTIYSSIPVYPSLRYSQLWVWDNITAVLVALHISSAKFVMDSQFFVTIFRPKMLVTLIRRLAGISFSLYVLHIPSLLFFSTLIDHKPDSVLSGLGLLLLTFLFAALVSVWTEKKKVILRSWFRRIYHHFRVSFDRK